MLGKKLSESPENISPEDAEKCSLHGDDAYDMRDYEEAVKWYRKAAEQGRANAVAALKKCRSRYRHPFNKKRLRKNRKRFLYV